MRRCPRNRARYFLKRIMHSEGHEIIVRRRLPAYAFYLGAVAAFLAGVGVGQAQGVVAVLSSGSGYYTESLEGFEKEWGQKVMSVNIANRKLDIPQGTGIVVAFGAKAALQPCPDTVKMIYWAPGLVPGQIVSACEKVKVSMLPRPGILLAKLKEMQPGLRNLRMLYISSDFAQYAEELKRSASAFGISFRPEKIHNAAQVPDRLRAMNPKPDAIWLAPDPMLINPQNFSTLKEYSWTNLVPLYTASSGLVEQGATASVAADFFEIGRVTALAARRALAEEHDSQEIYPELIGTSVNLSAASKAGLSLGSEFLRTVQKVFP